MAVNLVDIVNFCDERSRQLDVPDFEGAENGLQFENNGTVSKIGATVDGGHTPIKQAIEEGVDFLIVHHGMFWNKTVPVTGPMYQKFKTLFEGNLALYGSHLPLDAHPEIGNNAILANKLELKAIGTFVEYKGNGIAVEAEMPYSRTALVSRLKELFPTTYCGIEYGSENPERVAILTGSGRSAIPEMISKGIDTLITGELRQEHFNIAQEQGLNLYPCGHYATEVFGVMALAQEAAEKFGLEWCFIDTGCPL